MKVKEVLRPLWVAVILIGAGFLLTVLFTYNSSEDPTWHTHTAECAQYGCELVP